MIRAAVVLLQNSFLSVCKISIEILPNDSYHAVFVLGGEVGA